MAHFRATIQGSRGEASRLGGKDSGISAHVASWAGAVSVRLYERDGIDWAIVSLTTHHGHGTEQPLYNGPVGGKKKRVRK